MTDCACPVCTARLEALRRLSARHFTTDGPRPTAEQLERHAEKFGPEQVAETAAEFGLDVKPKREGWREKRDRLKRRRR